MGKKREGEEDAEAMKEEKAGGFKRFKREDAEVTSIGG